MALVLNDRVKETTTTTGTGPVALGGTSAGFDTFATGIGNSNTTYYTIAHQTADEWEVGLGTLDGTSANLTRTTVFTNSNGNTSQVTFSAGTKDVFVTYPSSKAVFKDASDNTNFADDEKIQLGTGNDLKIYHDGSNSYVEDVGTGDLLLRSDSYVRLQSTTGENMLYGQPNGEVTLYHNNVNKFSTTATGVQTVGTLNINAEYAFPTTDGNANQILETDGAGALTFVDKPTTGASAGFVIAMAVAL